jgi:anti-sigma B factor antagonist
MEMTVEERDGITRVSLSGKLDAKGADAIDTRFIATTKGRNKVAVDLSGVDYIASIGIRILVMAGKAMARNGGKIVLVGARETVAKVITTAGLDDIVPLVADWTAAQAALA